MRHRTAAKDPTPANTRSESSAGTAPRAVTAILVAMIVVSQVDGTDAIGNLLGLAIGMVVAPIVTIGLGVHIARAASGAPGPVDER